MAARAVVARRGDGRVAGCVDQSHDRPRVELRPVREHDERVGDLVAERRQPAPQRGARAAPPVLAVDERHPVEPRSNVVRTKSNVVRTRFERQAPRPRRSGTRPSRRAPPGRPAGARAAWGRRSGSRRRPRARPRRRSLDGDGRAARARRPRSACSVAGRRACRSVRTTGLPETGAEHGVVGWQPGVGARDDEELAAARSGRLGLRLRHRDDAEGVVACPRADGRPSCSRGRRRPSASGRRPG